jgi:Fe-S oxidoreductase
MVEIFRSAKKIFDPSDIMNSGKKVDSLDESPLRDLRYGENYQTRMGEMRERAKTLGIPSSSLESRDYLLNWGARDRTIVKKITGRDYEFDFEKEAECCFGCGQCREQSNTRRMCPVYDGMHDELDACRGRNNLLRWMNKLEGLASTFALTDDYRDAVYKHCIQCKMCMVDCPTNTNVAKLMAEARARYAKVKGHPKGYKYFFELDKYAEAGRKLAPMSNWLMRNSLVRILSEYITGIDRKKNFPPFHRKRFVDLFKEYSKTTLDSRANPTPGVLNPSKNAVFFYDTYINYNDPGLGMRIVRMLGENGIATTVPPQKSSGMPAIVEGAPNIGKEIAEYNVSNLIPYASKGIPIVTFSPSAGMTLKNDYLDVYDTPESRLVAQNTFDIHEYLSMLAHTGLLRREKMRRIDRTCLVHLHCHTIVQQVGNQVNEVLHMIPSLKFDILENGCCGNGGAYSFLKGNLEPSLKMGEKLSNDIKRLTIPVYSTGESCKVQLEQASGVKVGLTSELLAESFSV